MTTTIDQLISRLEAADAALGDWRDLPNTDRAQADYWARRKEIALHLNALRNTPADLVKRGRQLAEIEERRAVALAASASIEKQISDCGDPDALTDLRLREKEATRLADLKRSLTLLREGKLFKGPGERYEPVAYFADRIAELRARMEVLQARYDEHVRGAERLLAATTTVPQEQVTPQEQAQPTTVTP